MRRIVGTLGRLDTMKEMTPLESWAQLQACPDTLFVDVRMEIEHLYVGHPPGVVHVAWYEYPTMTTDRDEFVRRVRREAGDRLDRPVLLICRSGKRTVDAALTLEAAGFTDVAHVRHGFEGELDEHFRRGQLNGWRFDGLPWEQM
jgi:rhodanese-related sulfurtransferase